MEPELNYYPLNAEAPAQTPQAPQTNTPSVPVSALNIIPSGGGSIMASGAMQSPNFITGVAGWRLNSDGTIEGIAANFVDFKSTILFVAGENIDASATPQALYLKESDGKAYKLDATSAGEAAFAFIGFAIVQTAVLAGANIKVQTVGVVSGFSGLTIGGFYFGTNTAGTISTTAGTISLRVGRAVTASKILIEVGKKVYNGTTSFGSTTTTAITLGFRPARVRVHAVVGQGTNVDLSVFSNGGWDENGGNNCVYEAYTTPGANHNILAAATANAWYIGSDVDDSNTHIGTVTTITSTGFTLSNTKAGVPDTVYLFWQAEG